MQAASTHKLSSGMPFVFVYAYVLANRLLYAGQNVRQSSSAFGLHSSDLTNCRSPFRSLSLALASISLPQTRLLLLFLQP